MGLPSLITKNTLRSDAIFLRTNNFFSGVRVIWSGLDETKFLSNILHSLYSKGIANTLCKTISVGLVPWNDHVNRFFMSIGFDLLLFQISAKKSSFTFSTAEVSQKRSKRAALTMFSMRKICCWALRQLWIDSCVCDIPLPPPLTSNCLTPWNNYFLETRLL